MGRRDYVLFSLVVIFIAFSLAIIYYLAKSNLFSYATGVFSYGAITGFAGCLFLLSLILIISLRTTKSVITKKIGLVFSMLILSGSVAALLFFFKPGDSDVWWYGAIVGFLSCLSLVLLILAFYISYRLLRWRNDFFPCLLSKIKIWERSFLDGIPPALH